MLIRLTNTYKKRSDLSSRRKKYITCDNGTHPYMIVVNKDKICVYLACIKNKDYSKEYYDELFFTLTKFVGYWSGYDSSEYKMHHNSILIKLDKYQYMFIGHTIYTFKAKHKIIDFITPMGNNDVPYPIAYDEGYIYFMLDMKYMERNKFSTNLKIENAENIYYEFYRLKKYVKMYDFVSIKIINGGNRNTKCKS